MKVTLTKVTRYTTDKNGSPLIGKNGKPYTRVNIQTKEYGDKWLSGFGNQINQSWQEGNQVEIIVKENGQYLNFDTPSKANVDMQELKDRLKFKFEKIEANLQVINQKLGITSIPVSQPEDKTPDQKAVEEFDGVETQDEPPLDAYRDDEINPDDIHF